MSRTGDAPVQVRGGVRFDSSANRETRDQYRGYSSQPGSLFASNVRGIAPLRVPLIQVANQIVPVAVVNVAGQAQPQPQQVQPQQAQPQQAEN